MADVLTLTVQERKTDARAKQLRAQNIVPCVVYGNVKNTLLQCREQDVHRVYAKAGENTIVELEFDGKNIPVLFHSIEWNPISDRYDHIDFLAVDMSKEVTTHVPVRFIDESPAVKNLGAIFVTVLGELTVTCLPKDIPHDFQVSIAKLENFHDSITVADIAVPQGVTVKESTDKVVATVQEPRAIEEEPKPAAEGEEGAGEKAEGEGGEKQTEEGEKEGATEKSDKKE